MSVVKSYNDSINITTVNATANSRKVMQQALRITMRADLSKPINNISASRVEYLLLAEHTSLFEHVTYTFLITGISRALLAQLTRHRLSSFTVGSQQYQEYSSYPCSVHKALVHNSDMQVGIQGAYTAYSEMVKDNKPEEARQVLPSACQVNLLWTINARSLINFLRQRLCYRNVAEMRRFANLLRIQGVKHFPELFRLIGPQCYKGECRQAHLKCSRGPWTPTYRG